MLYKQLMYVSPTDFITSPLIFPNTLHMHSVNAVIVIRGSLVAEMHGLE
jgi:hypothetical protein